MENLFVRLQNKTHRTASSRVGKGLLAGSACLDICTREYRSESALFAQVIREEIELSQSGTAGAIAGRHKMSSSEADQNSVVKRKVAEMI